MAKHQRLVEGQQKQEATNRQAAYNYTKRARGALDPLKTNTELPTTQRLRLQRSTSDSCSTISLHRSPLPSREAAVGGCDGAHEHQPDQSDDGKLPLQYVQVAQPPQRLDHLPVLRPPSAHKRPASRGERGPTRENVMSRKRAEKKKPR